MTPGASELLVSREEDGLAVVWENLNRFYRHCLALYLLRCESRETNRPTAAFDFSCHCMVSHPHEQNTYRVRMSKDLEKIITCFYLMEYSTFLYQLAKKAHFFFTAVKNLFWLQILS